MKILLLIGAYIVILILDSPLLLEKNNKKLLYIYNSLFILGFLISLLQILDLAYINPTKVIEWIVTSILGVF